MNLNDKLKLEKTGMTQNELNELKWHLVDRIVDQMSMEDLVQYAVSYTHLTLPTNREV